jgi:hypothetical protein
MSSWPLLAPKERMDRPMRPEPSWMDDGAGELSQAIEALLTHNAYSYSGALSGGALETDLPLIKTGPTSTNVANI